MNSAIVRIYQSELDLIVHETSMYADIETGGSLYGLWTVGGNPTIVLATRPGPRAVRQQYQFEQDLQLHKELDNRLLETHGAQGIGLWHSHHGIGLHELSSGDLKRTMRFAERNKRPWFCDLLCYFTKGGHDPNREVAVKPYVYVDAPQGEHIPTELVVLPGISPVRTALLAAAETSRQAMQIALAAVPPDVTPKWRLARSTGHLSGSSEDGPADGPGFLQRLLGKRDKPADESAPVHHGAGTDGADKGDIERSDVERSDVENGPVERSDVEKGLVARESAPRESAEREIAQRVAAAPPPAPAPRPAADVTTRLAIPDLEVYMHRYLEPALASVPKGLRCEMATTNGGRWVRLTLRSPAREAVEVHLGWDGRIPVAFSLLATVRGEVPRQELLERPLDLVRAVEAGYEILTRYRRR